VISDILSLIILYTLQSMFCLLVRRRFNNERKFFLFKNLTKTKTKTNTKLILCLDAAIELKTFLHARKFLAFLHAQQNLDEKDDKFKVNS
jgi:hypothetical protein